MNLSVLENVKTFHLASTKENFDDKKLASSYDYVHLAKWTLLTNSKVILLK